LRTIVEIHQSNDRSVKEIAGTSPGSPTRGKVTLTLKTFSISSICLVIVQWVRWLRHTQDRNELERYGITPEALYKIGTLNKKVNLIDVRLPLDLLVHPEIIPGARWISLHEVLENPELIPNEKYSVVYCTCPSDESSLAILHRFLAMRFIHVRVLKGGLEGWKAKGYPVAPYKGKFSLDDTVE
jgi:rhodanese-related sulfurtransferase